mgnify:CR=1 FL=1
MELRVLVEQALPGVHVVITAADIPDQRPIGVAKDHFPLKVGRVRSQRELDACGSKSISVVPNDREA